MGQPRYDVSYESVGKWLIEEMVETATGTETDEATRATITDNQTGRSESGVGADEEEALAQACRNMGISESDLDEEMED